MDDHKDNENTLSCEGDQSIDNDWKFILTTINVSCMRKPNNAHRIHDMKQTKTNGNAIDDVHLVLIISLYKENDILRLFYSLLLYIRQTSSHPISARKFQDYF